MIEGRFTKTRKRREVEGEARYLTFSCQGRLPLFQNDAIKAAFVEHLRVTRDRTHFSLFAWVIMPEHVHLLIRPSLPAFPVPMVLSHLKGGFANTVLKRWRELEAPILSRLTDRAGKARFWLPGGGYDRNALVGGELVEKATYIHNNPVVRGLVRGPLDYEWSSARWHSGRRQDSPVSIDPVWSVPAE